MSKRIKIDNHNSITVDTKLEFNANDIIHTWLQLLYPAQQHISKNNAVYRALSEQVVRLSAWVPEHLVQDPAYAESWEQRKQSTSKVVLINDRIVKVFQENDRAAPAVLLANLVAIAAYIWCDVDVSFDEKHRYQPRILTTTGAHGHTVDRIGLVKYINVWAGALPRDDKGQVYAINPLFEMSASELLAKVSSTNFNLIEFIEDNALTMISRIAFDAPIPLAHAEHQSEEVGLRHVYSGMNMGHAFNCAGCGRSGDISAIQMKEGALHIEFKTLMRCFKECPAREIKPLTTSVVFPSGQLICADKHPAIPYYDCVYKGIDTNQYYGRRLINHKAADKGLVHGCTYNQPLTVYSMAGGNVIAVIDAMRGTRVGRTLRQKNQWKKVGVIDTDLWAYSIVDKETLKAIDPQWANTGEGLSYLNHAKCQVACLPGEYVQICLADEKADGSHGWKMHPEYLALPARIRECFDDIKCNKLAVILVNKAYWQQQI